MHRPFGATGELWRSGFDKEIKMEQRWAWGSHSLTQPRDVSMATRGTHPSLKWVYVSAIP